MLVMYMLVDPCRTLCVLVQCVCGCNGGGRYESTVCGTPRNAALMVNSDLVLVGYYPRVWCTCSAEGPRVLGMGTLVETHQTYLDLKETGAGN